MSETPATGRRPLASEQCPDRPEPGPGASGRRGGRRTRGRGRWWGFAAGVLGVAVAVQAFRPLPAPALVMRDVPAHFTLPGGNAAVPWPSGGQGAVTVVGSGQMETFGEQRPVPIASTAKMMTAYVLLRDHPLKNRQDAGPQIEVDTQAVQDGEAKDESRIEGLKVGQSYSEYDMLKMLMIPSGNNIARLVARWDTRSDSVSAFVAKMNRAAAELGMTHTRYTDPSGLERETVSTAVDQTRLAEAVMRSDAFRSVVSMAGADISGAGKLYNNNSLLMSDLSVRGIKTGSNTPAGGALSWAAYKTVDGKDRLLLGTVLDQHADGPDINGADSLKLVLENSRKIIEAVRGAVTSATIVEKGETVGYVDDGLGHRSPVVATKDVKGVGLRGTRLAIGLDQDAARLPGEAKAGTVVGRLTVGEEPEAVPVALQHDLTEPSLLSRLTRLG
ncbi:D-alanyl-D-alanine carboxypeptidase family protein [Streptomyces sp. NPDC001594]|uniref:D-alanyl-D-alanine carboxypeptidase family protein n=1 Tax=Streptomyces sp. NPDC001594 TaxID=3364590 RepID=UPI0036BFB76A